VAIAISVEYDSAGNVIALFSHYNGDASGTYYSVGKYTTTGVKIWTARFADGVETDGWGLAVSGNYIYVAGRLPSSESEYSVSTLTKLDIGNGTIEWSKVYDFGYASNSQVVDVASDGDPVMVGYASNGTDDYVATTKVDAEDGSIIWSRALNGQGDEEAYGMAVGPTGEVVAIGYMSQLGQEGDTDDHMLVVKYLSDGTIAWQKAILFDAGFDCHGADADIDSEGNIYVTGSYQYNSEINGTTNALSILKLDSTGAKQWSRRVTGTCNTFGVSVVVGADDKLYLSGVTGGNTDTNNSYTWVAAKYGFDGTVEWQRLIDHTDSWSFAGVIWSGQGGGSNLAVKDGYVVLGGGFGNLVNSENPRATVVQVAATGDVFSTGPWNFTAASFSGVLNSSASDITVVNADKTDTDNTSNIGVVTATLNFESNAFLIGTLYTAPDAGSNELVNGAYSVTLETTGAVTLPAGGTISEGYVTSNPTIQLTPASPTVASQKLVVKGGSNYNFTDNGITLNYQFNTALPGATLEFYVNGAITYANQTLYWWIYPESAGLTTPSSGTVTINENGGGGPISFVVDSDDYEFTVRVSPENNNYDPANVGVESGLINADEPAFDGDHHLHLTTGDLAVTSIILGTDDHNVRTTTDGNIEITTPGIATVSAIVFGGAGYTDGSYTDQATTGGSGTGLTVDYLVNTNQVVTVTINQQGLGYNNGDVITIPGGSSSATVLLDVAANNVWQFGTDGDLIIPPTGDIVRDGTSIFASSTALPIVTITNANYNQFDQPVAPATQTTEGAVVFTVTSPVALTATGLLLISGSNDKGGTIVPGGTSTGSQTLVFDMGGYNSTYTVMAFATTANGTSYSAPVAGNGGYVCFPAGTMITLSNGTKKAIEDIGYDDNILVWNFDLGEYASAKPIWIKASETATEYNVLTFSDGSVLKTVGNHHIFNKQAERFTHTMTADTPIGTVTVNEQGEEITLVSAEVVKESVEFYNVWTEYHLNMFAQGVLTSNRFNNTYPIVSMKFVKGHTELRDLSEFNGIDPKWIQGLRLQEQAPAHTAEYIKWYVSERLEKLSISSVEMVA
jgi:hypothetical protein